jgi:hypothetical protein
LGQCSPIGGADATGGTYTDPVRAFKLKSTVPVKMPLTDCDRAAAHHRRSHYPGHQVQQRDDLGCAD